MYVCFNVTPADSFLARLKALAFLVGPHFPNPILQTVQFEATEDGRGLLRATNGEDWAEVEAPLLKVIRAGTVQLPTFPVLRALADAAHCRSVVEIEGKPTGGISFTSDPKAPSRNVVVRTPSGRGRHQSAVALPTWNPDDFPALRPAEFTQSVEIDAWKLRLLTRTQASTSAPTVAAASHRDSLWHDVGGHAFELSDGEALHGLPWESGGGVGLLTRASASAAAPVACARRLLSEALPSQASKALTALLDTMEDTLLTMGFTAPWGKFQVKGPGLTLVTRLIGDERFAHRVSAHSKPHFVTQQEPTQEMPPMEETDSLRLHFSERTPTTMPAPKKNHEEQKERPVRVIRMKNIRGNIWANRLPSGQVVYNVTIDRLWRDDDEVDEGGQVTKKGEWHQSPSFGRDDLLLVAKVADNCHTWIFQRIQADSRNQDF